MINTFDRHQIETDESEPGIHMSDIGRAVMIWAAMNQRAVTVAEASAHFNTTDDVIRDAIEADPWLYLNGDQIEMDGE